MNKKDTKSIITWLGISTVLIAITLFAVSSGGAGTTQEIGENDRWVLGNKDATVSLVEYSDFQCPFCSNAAAMVDELMKNRGDKVQFAYRHFPLKSIHKNSLLASQATESAGEQGKFWEMNKILFERQSEWSGLSWDDAKKKFVGYSKELDLDASKFAKDMLSQEIEDRVNDAYDYAVHHGLNSTPTFYLNGKKIETPRSYKELEELIDSQANAQ